MKGRADKMSSPLERRLNAYAIAASAAGVGLLALSPSAEARVIYTPAHLHIGVDSTLLLDLNHDGIIDFTIHNHFFFTTTPVAVELWVNPRHKNAVRGIPNRGYGSASALEAGINVKQQNGFLGAGQKFGPLMADWFTSRSISYSAGSWKDVRNRYLGLKFYIDGKVHYGWARLNVTVIRRTNHGDGRIEATLTGYAYETVPGKNIVTGETKAADDGDRATTTLSALPNPMRPEAASLGLLTMGSPALSIWRREQSATNTQ